MDFDRGHMDGILRLCEDEGWTALAVDPARSERALSAPGVVTLVAVADGEVVGFAQALTDGAIQAYLCVVVVAAPMRGGGIGRQLVSEVLARSGAKRLDLLAANGTERFYDSFPHRVSSGYRLDPGYE
ncbi:MAG TPA: GNAT family N-acetyltransferase [Solirubrobacteraceae bacterium]|nr:GNAT family N-acetyltransferase [Solirubrobacteraceae bacterium]